MSLYGDIMNLQVDPYIETLPQEVRLTFKNGHKAARHGAAELVLKYERALEEALVNLELIRDEASEYPDLLACESIEIIREILGDIKC